MDFVEKKRENILVSCRIDNLCLVKFCKNVEPNLHIQDANLYYQDFLGSMSIQNSLFLFVLKDSNSVEQKHLHNIYSS